jgi:hypothetical protein
LYPTTDVNRSLHPEQARTAISRTRLDDLARAVGFITKFSAATSVAASSVAEPGVRFARIFRKSQHSSNSAAESATGQTVEGVALDLAGREERMRAVNRQRVSLS